MAKRKLQTQFQRSIILIPLLSLLTMGVCVVLFYYHSLKNNVLENNHKTTKMLSFMLAGEVRHAENQLATLTNAIENYLLPESHLDHILTNHIQKLKSLRQIRIIDSMGYVETVVPLDHDLLRIDMSTAPFIKQALNTGKSTWSKSHLSLKDGMPVSSLAIPFSRGMVIAYFDLDTITKPLNTFQSSQNRVITILDQGGVYLYHPDQTKVHRREYEPLTKNIKQAITKKTETTTFIEKDGILATASPIINTAWQVVIFQNQKDIIAPVIKLSILLLLGGVLLATLTLLLALKISNRYFGYFSRLALNIHDVAEGIYNRKFPSEGYEELQNIGVDFYRMTQQIENREKKISTLNNELQHKLKEAETAIRQRKEAEKELVKSHETFNLVLDGIDATIHVTDLRTNTILFANKKLRDLYPDEELIGKQCWTVLRKLDSPCSSCSIHNLLDEAGKPGPGRVWQEQNTITGQWQANHSRAVKWIDGSYVNLNVATDITTLKKMEEQLRQSQKMEAIGTLAGGVAHDFNNILSAIFGYAELAKVEQDNQPRLQHDLEQILQGANRAKELVRQILAFSRQGTMELQNLRFQNVISEAVNLLRSTIPTTIAIKTDIEQNCPEIMADPTELHQVIMNICTNGYHAMRETGGTLTLSLGNTLITKTIRTEYRELPPGNYVQFKVCDTGHGMSPDILNRIFDPYFTSKEVGKGTGLGLAVVHGIINKYGGHISVESIPDHGSTFTILLPPAKIVAEPLASSQSSPDLPGGDESVLIVDDDPAIANLSSRLLESLGYRTTVFTSSVNALEKFKQRPDEFDLVVTDMTMPQMTGAELSTSLLSIRNDLPIILCTGYSELIDEAQSKEIGIRSYLMKPATMRTLTTTIRQILDS